MIRRLAVLALCWLALAPPAAAQTSLVGRPYGVPSRAYLRAHGAVTEKLVVYMGFPTALLTRATLITPGFLEAMAFEHARMLGPALRDPNALIQQMRLDHEGVIEVVFTADSALPFGEDFADDQRGWTVRMEADGIEQPLISVEHIRSPTPTHFSLFPQLTIWAELWVARFQRTIPSPESIELHVGSGYGHGTLTWTHTDRREQRLERAFRAIQEDDR